MVKEIPLTQGKVALVDDGDYADLNKHKWCAHKQGNQWYVMRHTKKGFRIYTQVYMHREIMEITDGKVLIDHINGDGLDNRRCNLRLATRSQNMFNRGKQSDNTTGRKGVTIQNHNNKKPYRASIQVDGKMINLGYYKTLEEAARAYDEAAIKFRGEFGKTNF